MMAARLSASVMIDLNLYWDSRFGMIRWADPHRTAVQRGDEEYTVAEHVQVQPSEVHEVLGRHLLGDGLELVARPRAQPQRLLARRRPQRPALPRPVHVLRLVGARSQPPGLVDDPTSWPSSRRRRSTSRQPRRLHQRVCRVRATLRPGTRRPGAAAPVLRRGRRAGRGERSEGRLRLEEPAQRGGTAATRRSAAPAFCT